MLALLIMSVMFAVPVPKDPVLPALRELQGEWRAISVEEKGKPWNSKDEVAEVCLEIAGDTLIYKRNKEHVEKFRITLIPGKKPGWLDLRLIAEGVDPAKASHAIYALERGKLKLCLATEFTANDPEERPQEFTTGSERPPQGRLLFVMERVKK